MNRRSFFFAGLAPLAVPAFAGVAWPLGPESGLRGPRFRQVHLDFHTSELIPDVGLDFDPQNFLHTLQAARVDSINVFAKCHHGYLYYDSKIGTKHPSGGMRVLT